MKKLPTKSEVKRKLSSCVEERFIGFQVARHLSDKEEKRKFYPLDVVYKPVKRLDEIIECYFTNEVRLAYRALIYKGKFKFDSVTTEQCYSAAIDILLESLHLINILRNAPICLKLFASSKISTLRHLRKILGLWVSYLLQSISISKLPVEKKNFTTLNDLENISIQFSVVFLLLFIDL